MGYSETMCQLCGVSFAIARIRRAGEPEEAAWTYTGSGYVDEVADTCGEFSGCQALERADLENGFVGSGEEHISGPGCICTLGYCGYRISTQEMRGCRAMQCLLKKEDNWETESDDQDLERESGYFLTGLGDGSPNEAPLGDISPDDDPTPALPFHPTCFEIFKKVSASRLGRVDVHGLWMWRQIEHEYEDFFENFPRSLAVRNGCEQWWCHEPGNEYLAANPIDIPGFSELLKSCGRDFTWSNAKKIQPLKTTTKKGHSTPPPTTHSDMFGKLPLELRDMVLDHLSAKDIANLRRTTMSFRQLPVVLFRRLLLEDMPFLWEAQDMPVGTTDWFRLYKAVKGCWQDLNGVKNRKRIWKDVNEIVNRVERYKKEGKILDE
ncbi:hypothetical protein G7Y89_g9085 [Cudoniella acicularis]|uniref:F-box domain-containing protein n=1 Tax=Cudoniella acicularis TaxID=354080 RepID=A0A8H4VZZ7_9HELO|nr:hypothetical protein G7Y89_g9085 [Cudoniella acicularis]